MSYIISMENEGVKKMTKTIWCEGVEVPNVENGNRVSYKYISGGDFPNYEWSMVTSFLSNGDQADFQRAVESCLTQAQDNHHVYIEGFNFNEEMKTWEVVLGS